MNYDKITSILEKHPWITIVMAFVVVSLCLLILFTNYGQKTDTTKMMTKPAKPVLLIENNQTTRMLTQNQQTNQNNLLPHQRPLLSSLTEVQCSVHQHRFIPLCPRCNVPLEFVSGTTFQCPNCKQKTEVMCPVCGKPMELVQGPAANSDAMYYCPICKKEVIPNWEKNGTPICPYCNNRVRLN